MTNPRPDDIDPIWAKLARLAREATNGWACYAKTKREQDDISRLHREIDSAIKAADAEPAALDQVRQQLAEAKEQPSYYGYIKTAAEKRADAAEAKLAEAEHEAEEQKARADHHVRIAQKRGEKHDALRSALAAKELEWREPTGAYANLRSETAYNKAREGCADDLAALLSPPSGTETKP